MGIIVSPENALYGNKEVEGCICRPLREPKMRTKRSFAVLRERTLSAVAGTFLEFCEQ